MTDRQLSRYADARRRHHEARQHHADALRELDAASAELVVAGAAMAERLQIVASSSVPRSVDLAAFDERAAA